MHSKTFGVTTLVLGLAAFWFAPTARGDEIVAAKKVDPSGTWKWERTFNDNTVKFVIRLRLDGDKVVGTYRGGFRDVDLKIEDGKLEGDKVSFQYDGEFNGNAFTAKYHGQVAEDTIKGAIEFSSDAGEREFEWEAKRSTELVDVLGTWKFKIETPGGEVLEPGILLSKDGDNLKGEYDSRVGKMQATDIKLENNVLTFRVSGENNGNQFTVIYKGKPKGDSISGTIDYDFGENTGTVDFVGKRAEQKKE